MQVILLKDIKGIGKKDEIKNVSEGYAKNFLIPRRLVVVANELHIKEKQGRVVETNVAHAKKERQKKELERETMIFKIKTGENGSVFGSVTKAEIEKILSQKGYKNIVVDLEKPIKTVGESIVEINLGDAYKAKLKVVVAKI